MKFDLVGNRHWFFLVSGALAVLSLIVLAIPPVFRPGIEFTSGTTTLIRFEGGVSEEALRGLYQTLGHPEARIQQTGSNEFLIRTRELQVPVGSFSEAAPTPVVESTPVGPQPAKALGTVKLGREGAAGDVLLRAAFQTDPCAFGDVAGTVPAGTEAQVINIYTKCGEGDKRVFEVVAKETKGLIVAGDTRDFQAPADATAAGSQGAQAGAQADLGERGVIEKALKEKFGNFEVREFASVSALVSAVAVRNAAIAVVVASVFILGYVAFAFSSVPRPWRYGTSAIVATLHDVLMVLGAFSLFGKIFGTEIDLMFVTGVLTIIGFSVHDTIVVFDRIRENVRLAPDAPLEDNVNAALVQTMARSLNTSLTVLITVAAMLLLGGVTIREFLLVILIGVISGAYSSIGIASQILVAWELGDFRRWVRLLRRRQPDLGERRA